MRKKYVSNLIFSSARPCVPPIIIERARSHHHQVFSLASFFELTEAGRSAARQRFRRALNDIYSWALPPRLSFSLPFPGPAPLRVTYDSSPPTHKKCGRSFAPLFQPVFSSPEKCGRNWAGESRNFRLGELLKVQRCIIVFFSTHFFSKCGEAPSF